MTQPNPFAPPAAPAAEPAVPAQPVNPFGQPAAVPQAHAAPAAPTWLAQPTVAEQATYQQPTAPAFAPPAAPTASGYTPPALNLNGAASVAPAALGGIGADLWSMAGRLVMVLPLHIATEPIPEKWITPKDREMNRLTREKITANVVVLSDKDGGTADLEWGGDPRTAPGMPGYKPHTNIDPLPYVRKGMWLSGKLIDQLRPGLPGAPGAAPSPMIGKVWKDGPDKTDPWYLMPATAEDIARAKYYLAAVERGQFPHPLAP